jgi:hypothetical protein
MYSSYVGHPESKECLVIKKQTNKIKMLLYIITTDLE